MQKIRKFHPGRLYSSSTVNNFNWYELTNRDGKHLTFRVRKAGTKDTWTQETAPSSMPTTTAPASWV